jgi:hypothetical protein
MRTDPDQRTASTAGATADCGPGAGDGDPARARLEQAVGRELAQRLLTALSGPHGRHALQKP